MSKVALITGTSSGVGLNLSIILAKRGYKVYASMRNLAKKDNLLTAAKEAGVDLELKQLDVQDMSSINQCVDEIIAVEDKLDVLVNNAGAGFIRTTEQATEEEIQWVIDVNLTGVIRCTKAVLPHMKEAGYGRIVSASSINGFAGAFGQVNYAATKAAVAGFTRALCKETGRFGVTVNAVAPGFIKTNMTDSMPDEVIKAGVAQIPVGRIGTVEDMGFAYLYLASKEAGFISGITLHANGGSMPM